MPGDPHVDRLRVELERLMPSANAEGAGPERFAELLGMFLANVPDFILLLATDGTILFLNRARPGKTIQEIVGHNIAEYDPDGAGSIRESVDRVVATGQTLTVESRATFTDGSVHDFLTRLAPVCHDGRIVAVGSIATEITAQKRADAAPRDSEETLRLPVAATGMGLWSWDIERDVVFWDEPMCRIWGVTGDTVPQDQDSYLALIHPEDRARVVDIIAGVVQCGFYPDFEHRIVRPDGTVRRVLTKGTITFTEAGKPDRLVGGVLDVTEQRAIEERSRQTQKLEAIGQLSAGVAHNFNNLLTAILPNIELALVDAPPATAAYLRGAQEAGLRAAELVRQLVTFAGRDRPSRKRADDVRALVERTVAICRRAFDRSVELSSHCPDEPLPALADATQLEHALLNLLINARDAVTEPEITIRRVRVEVERVTARGLVMSAIGLEVGRPYVRVRVIDSGVGMDAATQNRIYEPFFTTKEVGKGTGLGLSTARTIVEEHGGVLECSSTKGAGTTFSVYLPLASSVDPGAAAAVVVEKKRGTETILVVDDEAPVREVVRAMLESAGYTVLVAPGGREALDLLSSEDVRRRVALVLLDVTMPGMSGDTTRRHLRELAPDLKIAYFSGHALEASDDVAGVFPKPISQAALVRGIRALLDPSGTRR